MKVNYNLNQIESILHLIFCPSLLGLDLVSLLDSDPAVRQAHHYQF